jgi:iron complex transport system ATP-binding protein
MKIAKLPRKLSLPALISIIDSRAEHSIVSSYLKKSEVMLLDEPTSSLDLKYQQETLNLIKALRSKGLTIIIAIHDLTQAYRVSDKILMLNNGKVFAAGKPEEVLTPQKHTSSLRHPNNHP